MYSIVFITFHIGNFLSVSGFGHAICDSFRNEHVVILLDMMLRAWIAKMNMRAMMVIVIGSIIMMNKGKRRSARRRNKRFHRGANFEPNDSVFTLKLIFGLARNGLDFGPKNDLKIKFFNFI